MRIQSAIIIIILSWLLCQCSNRPESDGGRDYPSKKTFTSIDSCMACMSSDPGKAHRMLDSLKNARLMTPQRCDYFHAMVVYSGENKLDSALAICDRLLDEGRFGDDDYLEEEICVLASDITSSNKRHIETLKYANRGIAICHGNEKMRYDEATLMARVGVAEQALGRTEQAREIYARAYSLLDENESFGDFIAFISLKKKQASLHYDAKEYDEVIAICHEILDMIEHFDRDPSFVKQRPETMQQSGEATHDFADFYRTQMYAQIARAYRVRIESNSSANANADRDSVRAYMEMWEQTKSSKKPESIALSLRELYFAGKKTAVLDARHTVEDMYRNDSLSLDYIDYLTLAAQMSADASDLKESNAYLWRAVTVSDSVLHNEMLRKLSEQMSINMVQEHKLARQDAEQQLKYHRLLILIMAILIVAGVIITALINRNRRNKQIIETTQHNLLETQEEVKELVQQLEETRTDKAVNNTLALYERIQQTMTEGKLYLNPDLDIKMLAEAVYSNRSVVSSCINSMTGKNFRQWISEYRLNLFVQMLKASPEESIDVLMLRCGYKDQSTFRRQFKAAYGMTAGEYRKTLDEGK